MEFTFLESALIWGIFTHALSYSKLAAKILFSFSRREEIVHSPWQHFFENLSLVNSKKWWRKLETWVDDMLYQNSVRKLKKTWNIRFFIFCMIYNFFKCDGFTILQIISIIKYGNNLLLLLCNDDNLILIILLWWKVAFYRYFQRWKCARDDKLRSLSAIYKKVCIIIWKIVYLGKVGKIITLCILKTGWVLKYFWPITNILKNSG